jgi:anaerobic selenocysteine-containing dehydrogenase
MTNEDKDKVKRDHGDAAAHPAPPQPTRRQLLKGLTTGTVALGALSQAGCGPAMPPLKTHGATETTTVCPFCGVGCGQVVATRNGHFGLVIGVARTGNAAELRQHGAHLVVHDLGELVDGPTPHAVSRGTD